ncbi:MULTISPECIES: malonyl-CoA decarboxylase [unclassified Polaromonas]|uniref:malonyl-CoA decarboxylase n=1 Tax=unclassified Polaromonas TaxID=2638319 RepID=UPI0018CB1BAE|nr:MULTISPECIES: malonyl-CoA decarboxylase [unclassified Polaromonas]MBG6070623.1 malonyl-CoA decarboxylase [Polaromonas sp. CG_9.7]MBG6112621.1 malonyl-CoA decarboxylase [Polaromonas sp. CG_9.2]
MSSTNWLGRVSRLLPAASSKPAADPPDKSGPLQTPLAKECPLARSIAERLDATLRQEGEALSPRLLRRAFEELQAIIDPRVSEVEGGRRAMEVAAGHAAAPLAQRCDLWLLMSEMFVADAQKTREAQARFAAAVGTPDEAVAEVHYRRATVSPRRRLLQRFSVYPQGVQFLVELRAEMLPFLKADGRLMALDVEMEYMFSTWFDVGFLELRRISWDSPASLIEKLIQYEAVHDIKSWADVKNRLDSDRRCYGFFHPRLPGTPLIFVEVALVDEMTEGIMPLLDEQAAAADLGKATTAIFYSISNTQRGLRGVSFGDSLIKRVVETLKDEFPKLKVFATLSPIPGLRNWLGKNAAALLEKLSDKERAVLGQALGSGTPMPARFLAAIEHPQDLQEKSPVRHFLLQCASHYLGQGLKNGQPLDPVARFHLGNGARVERLNWAADPSPKGVKQSYGLMVNYLYDLKRLDKHRAMLAQGKVPVSTEVHDLYI